ncbi:LacI family DNA-binding transcriptional regulator [Cellulomonas wangsupingiae]|uniref:LacI family transcriptional regulator n=1 Tax=Cellulomonas wangsupingiae TaxID=2968085 RepID=A0ABY5K9A7_9CELL|nr:LacI family DNA-binding transcriptional regulator [Cellulomonas wangsupingiae]MCC2334694.1 LacI family transcriptional regulator [Cellulomonas wangsupingiae]MCM0638586.1 LacI family transcriptional regulator [Cellulomonas wangsupingiae]UUI66348.1 LacI family transcriptional regulator [Cellulomonas wangsupingiae]
MTTTPEGRVRPVTLREVAQLAGVSVATASKALNGKADVHPDTRRRVQEAADRLAFTPNFLARAITAGQTGTVGLLTHDLEGRFSLPILMGAEDAFGAGRTSVFLCDARDDAIREQHHLRALLGRRIDGLIVVGSTTDPRTSLGHDVPVPVVYAYAPSDDPQDASVVPDNVTAGRIATEHLLTLGRRRVAHVSGDPTYAAAQDRATGVAQALADAGLELSGPVRFGSWTEAWGRAGVGAALDADPGIDAVVCGSDQIARGVLDALRERGIAVPGDVAVIGFDNWEPMIAGSRPALTSVDMNFEKMGRRAATRLFAGIAGKPEHGVEMIAPRVVVRGSTASG